MALIPQYMTLFVCDQIFYSEYVPVILLNSNEKICIDVVHLILFPFLPVNMYLSFC